MTEEEFIDLYEIPAETVEEKFQGFTIQHRINAIVLMDGYFIKGFASDTVKNGRRALDKAKEWIKDTQL